MTKLLIFMLLLSAQTFAKDMPDSELMEERSLDEAQEIVNRSKADRKAFENKGPERGIASEEDFDPEFQKDFDDMMEEQDQY